MATQMEDFNGEWEDTEGNQIVINGKSVLGPSGIELDIVFESDNTCLMQMGDEFYEGALSGDSSCIEWSDGEIWKRTSPKQDAKTDIPVRKQQTPGVLTLEDTLAMQEELRKGFSSNAFQAALLELSNRYPDRGLQYISARSDLFLEVQSKVLPSYGFAGTQQGVIEMLKVVAQWNGNKQFRENRDELNRLLGLIDSPPDESEKPSKQSGNGIILRNPLSNLGSAHKPLLLPSSLQLNLPLPGAISQKQKGSLKMKSLTQNGNGYTSNENFGIAEIPQRTKQISPNYVEIRAHEALGDLEITVTLPETATFSELKEAISRHVGRPDIMKRGHLVHNVNSTYVPFKNTDTIGDVREVLVLRASLVVHSDHEAHAWRQTLEKSIQDRRTKFEETLAAAKKRQDELAQCAIDLAARANQVAPHGDCYIVGTWDDFAEKHKMMWDGSSYRIGMNLQGTTEISFQIIAHDSWDSRIYPSDNNAGPNVAHSVLGPGRIDSDKYWTLHVENEGAEDEKAYEIVLHCPVGHAMSLDWEKVSLDSIAWYSTAEGE